MDRLQVAGHFGMYVDFLIRAELRCHFHVPREVSLLGTNNGDR
jgi:hypothetical protein